MWENPFMVKMDVRIVQTQVDTLIIHLSTFYELIK